MFRLFFLVATMIGCVWFSGCDFPEIQRPVAGVAGVDIAPETTMSGGSDTNDSNASQQPATTPPQPQEGRKTAEVGDGRKGHYEEFGRMSIFSHNIGAMYRMQERLTYNIEIPHAMNLYKATNGRAPQTHEEFWREIIQANKLKMPELKEGCRYEYNPQTEELEVVYPLDLNP